MIPTENSVVTIPIGIIRKIAFELFLTERTIEYIPRKRLTRAIFI